VQRNDGGFAAFLTDDDYNVRLVMRQRPDGGMDVLQRAANGSFTPFESIGPDDSLTTFPVGFDSAGQTLYFIDSRGRDTAVVVGRNMASDASTVLAQDARVDAENALAHPKTGILQAVAFNYDRVRWQYNFARPQKALGGTPAMAAGLADNVCSVEEIVGLLDAAEKKAA
jgi:hypothetical protein